LDDITAIALTKKLKGYEIPWNIHLEQEKFTVENSRLTSSFKTCRPVLDRHYKLLVSKLVEEALAADKVSVMHETFG
jgi:hypothetical protein